MQYKLNIHYLLAQITIFNTAIHINHIYTPDMYIVCCYKVIVYELSVALTSLTIKTLTPKIIYNICVMFTCGSCKATSVYTYS